MYCCPCNWGQQPADDSKDSKEEEERPPAPHQCPHTWDYSLKPKPALATSVPWPVITVLASQQQAIRNPSNGWIDLIIWLIAIMYQILVELVDQTIVPPKRIWSQISNPNPCLGTSFRSNARTTKVLSNSKVAVQELLNMSLNLYPPPPFIFALLPSVLDKRPYQPLSEDYVPAQSIYTSFYAIPLSLANRTCESLGVEAMLSYFNEIMGTHYTFLSNPALEDLLKACVERKDNFGLVYACLWRHWFSDLSTLKERM